MSGDRPAAAVAPHPDGTVLRLVIVPRAGVTAIERVEADGTIRLRVAAPPVDGAANAAVVRFLSNLCGVAKGRVRIVAGETGRRKRILIGGLTPAEVAAALDRSDAGRSRAAAAERESQRG